MIRIVIFIFLLAPNNSLLAGQCKKTEREQSFKVICSLELDNRRVEFIAGKQGCEFPEGHKSDCAYALVCDGSSTRRSSVVFFKDVNMESYCLSVGAGDKSLVSSKDKNAEAILKCPVKEQLDLLLKIQKKTQSCQFNFSKLNI